MDQLAADRGWTARPREVQSSFSRRGSPSTLSTHRSPTGTSILSSPAIMSAIAADVVAEWMDLLSTATGKVSEAEQRKHVRAVLTENGSLPSQVIDRRTQYRIRPSDRVAVLGVHELAGTLGCRGLARRIALRCLAGAAAVNGNRCGRSTSTLSSCREAGAGTEPTDDLLNLRRYAARPRRAAGSVLPPRVPSARRLGRLPRSRCVRRPIHSDPLTPSARSLRGLGHAMR